ncbi:chromosome (plasmid) partitioning protein ParB [Pseudoalteromonas sp. SW0106-04]|uniref:transcriptional regulator n=1 Tax=Pseudoalteromonas sp. SW0106-04 TaxID=1702169 RepID=UPI0006B499A0|nr:transcriptional regulator [Pseudoalteromonas sp. SW0106-04]GAP73701.1 chromosome (plasmid) partitioning protein ParB [Pseudoalteromonas sp. SW0106-04]
MAKKRKNDTRIDPFATAVENSSLDQLLEQAQAGDVISMPAPSDPQRTIRLTCEVIPHAEIEQRTKVYGKNRRVQALLTEKSVADILPAIAEDGRNQHPALAWEHDDGLFVLAGSRRRKACILAKADYLVLSSADFNDEDAKILAVSSDQYIAPSLWELGQAYVYTRDELQLQGKKGSYREIAALEGVSHTAIADAIKAYECLPHDVLALYPTANYVGREVAKKLIQAKDKDAESFNERVKQCSSHFSDQHFDSDDKAALAVTKYLCDVEQAGKRTQDIDLGNDFVRVQKHTKSGDVTIKIDNKVLTDKRFAQLAKMLESFN